MQLDVEIVNDNQWEPDEEFYLRMSLLNDSVMREGVQLGRVSIMEVVILNDDGEWCGGAILWCVLYHMLRAIKISFVY